MQRTWWFLCIERFEGGGQLSWYTIDRYPSRETAEKAAEQIADAAPQAVLVIIPGASDDDYF